MTFFVANTAVINNDGTVVVGSYSTRASLPSSGANAYIAYVTDQADFTFNNGAWYKFKTKPLDYKNEVILEQGTVGGGYIGSSIWSTISRVIYSNDIITEDAVTMPFTNNYGGHHATETYAYYHRGGNAESCKQSWATGTVSSITARVSASWTSPNSLQPGPKVDNTKGVLLSGTSGVYLTFANDTWTSGLGAPTSQGYGDGSFGQTYGYTYTYGSSVQYLNWGTSTWTGTSSGNAVNAAGNYGKTLTTKMNKFYYMGDNTAGSGIGASTVSKFDMATNGWTNTNSPLPATWSEGAGLMGQDWGYMVGGYNTTTSVQGSYTTKHLYATDTTIYSALATSSRTGLSSGAAAWGPIP